MRIHVKLFAALREAAGEAELILELPEGASASSVRQPLLERFPALARLMRCTAFAINRAYAEPDALLHEGDEVALLPPVSGG